MKKIIFKLCIVLTAFTTVSCEELLNSETSTEIAQAIEGEWICEESSIFKSTEATYTVYIYPSDTDSTLVYIENFLDLGKNIEASAKVNGHEIKLIPETLEGGFDIRGTGTITSNLRSVNWIYYVDYGTGEEVEVTATYTLHY